MNETGRKLKEQKLPIFFISFLSILYIAYEASAETKTQAFDLKVPITLKETAGVGVRIFPVKAVVPFPRGVLKDTDMLVLKDPEGKEVNAQFDVLNRWWSLDRSIRHVKVEFLASVPPFRGGNTGTKTYFLSLRRAKGRRYTKESPLKVVEDRKSVIVVTGPLMFEVLKKPFQLLHRVWFDMDKNGKFEESEQLISDKSSCGSLFIGRSKNDIQPSWERKDVSISIEEKGPVCVTIKAWSPTLLEPSGKARYGFCVRIKAWAGLPWIKIDYQLQNSALSVPQGSPLYFDSLTLQFPLLFKEKPKIRVLLEKNEVLEFRQGRAIRLAQKFHDKSEVLSLRSNKRLASAGSLDTGALDISCPQWGVSSFMRYFWQLWPNGIQVNEDNVLTFELFPSWSAQWFVLWEPKGFSPTGLYWLEDMQQCYKEILLCFHGKDFSNKEFASLARTFTYVPVCTIGLSWYAQARATLDMGGEIPKGSVEKGQEQRLFNYKSRSYWFNSLANHQYKFGWDFFFVSRKRDVAQAGGWPVGGSRFIASSDPADYFHAEAMMLGELNIRPHWLPGYNHKRDSGRIPWVNGALWQPNFWRKWKDLKKLYLPGTWQDARPRDHCHFWYYHVEVAYYLTANPWVRDWYEFLKEYLKFYLTNPELMSPASRAVGEVLSACCAAYRVTGDLELLRLLGRYIKENLSCPDLKDLERLSKRNRNRGIHPLWGLRGMKDAVFQAGFLARAIIDYLEEVNFEDPKGCFDPEGAAYAWNALSGLMAWNLNMANFSYYLGAGKKGTSSLTSLTFVDPQAWYFLHTRRKQFFHHLQRYLNKGIDPTEKGKGKGQRPASCDVLTADAWPGTWEGRHSILARKKVGEQVKFPDPINDLVARREGTEINLSWTAPPEAFRYHIVWSDREIVEEYNPDPKLCNWWAANPVGNRIEAKPGTKINFVFKVPEGGKEKVKFIGIFSFSKEGAMSKLATVQVKGN